MTNFSTVDCVTRSSTLEASRPNILVKLPQWLLRGQLFHKQKLFNKFMSQMSLLSTYQHKHSFCTFEYLINISQLSI